MLYSAVKKPPRDSCDSLYFFKSQNNLSFKAERNSRDVDKALENPWGPLLKRVKYIPEVTGMHCLFSSYSSADDLALTWWNIKPEIGNIICGMVVQLSLCQGILSWWATDENHKEIWSPFAHTLPIILQKKSSWSRGTWLLWWWHLFRKPYICDTEGTMDSVPPLEKKINEKKGENSKLTSSVGYMREVFRQ